MHRSWSAICGEKDQVLRLLLSSATDPRILEGLQKGFPGYFSDKEAPLRVPLSAILAWRNPDNKDDFVQPQAVLEHFGIPYFLFGKYEKDPYPTGIRELLGDKNIAINGEAGDGSSEEIHFTWLGRECLVAEYAADEESRVILVQPEFIDLKS